jgi:bifunctional DNA-binding transcriptional regulator/antitoxin component of YhaV-PrlF toxin-antitoxin module
MRSPRYQMNSKGQIVIPKAIRESLGIGRGWVALQGIEEHHVVVYFVPRDDESSKAMWPAAARGDRMA